MIYFRKDLFPKDDGGIRMAVAKVVLLPLDERPCNFDFPYYLYNISSPSLMALSFYLKLKKRCRNIKDRCFLSRKEIIDLNAYLY